MLSHDFAIIPIFTKIIVKLSWYMESVLSSLKPISTWDYANRQMGILKIHCLWHKNINQYVYTWQNRERELIISPRILSPQTYNFSIDSVSSSASPCMLGNFLKNVLYDFFWSKSVLLKRCFYAPAIYNGGGGGGHIASPLSVCTYVHPVRPVPYVRKMVSGRYLLKTLVYWIHFSYTGT